MHFLINVTALLTETMGDGNKMLDLGQKTYIDLVCVHMIKMHVLFFLSQGEFLTNRLTITTLIYLCLTGRDDREALLGALWPRLQVQRHPQRQRGSVWPLPPTDGLPGV